jgi:flagellar hook-associated protein FlgK
MHLDSRRDAMSGVDPNEELTRMLQFQRHFQAGAQVLRVVHETTADLLNLLG